MGFRFRRSWESISTTVIIGSADDLISDDDRARASKHFVEVQILPTDHFIIFRHPEAVSDAVIRALEGRHRE